MNITKKDWLLLWWSSAIFNFVRVMRLFGKCKVAVFMAFCLIISLLVPVSAEAVLGVNEGDWALYNIDSLWSSEIPGDTMPQYLADINNTQWKLQVKNIIGTESVSLSVTKYYRNGTVMSVEIYEGDVRTGSGNLSMWIIPKNLNVDDPVYVGKDLTVNATNSREFAGAARLTVYAWIVQEEEAGGNTTGRYAIWWDRETGIFCGGVSDTIRIVGDMYLSRTVIRTSIVETSLWEPSNEIFWFLGIGVIIIVLVLVVVAQRSGKLKWRKTRKRSIDKGNRT
jgi:hypothetical protein